MKHTWILKTWQELSPEEIHAILQLRIDVFVVEQNCPYPELDGKDPKGLHLFTLQEEKALAVCRILPPGVSYPEVSIGRVATSTDYRATGLGKELMRVALEKIEEKWNNMPITISAQSYLEKFYSHFGFQTCSEPYLEDDIPHVKMRRA